MLTAIVFGFTLQAQNLWQHGRLKISPGGHYLQYEDGTPFFWLGDTGWELFHRLTLEEIGHYLKNRADKGFTVIQAVALAEFEGLKQPNRYGQVPFHDMDPARPNEAYFKIIDSAIHIASRVNIFIGLLPAWGDKITKNWGAGPAIFDSSSAYRYGKWLGNRYKDDPNIIWILGGDRPAVKDSMDWRPVWRAMAQGIIDATQHQCLITYHPWGGANSTSQWLQNENWLDINMFQSGHGSGHDVACWDLVTRDWNIKPAKPVLDGEPNYEDHPVNPWPKWNPDNGYFRDYDVRKQTYRSVFAGACGVTYGHHAVWQFMSERTEAINYPDRGWVNAMDRPGAFQVGYLKKLLESRPVRNRLADSTIIIKGQGTKGEHVVAFRAADSSYAMIYIPVGESFTIGTHFFPSKHITVSWFNPQTGNSSETKKLDRKDEMEFVTPTTGIGNDWVLVMDAERDHEK